MKKRIIAILSALMLLFGCLPAYAAETSYIDVPVNISLNDVSGVNITIALNPHFVETAEELPEMRASVLDGKMIAAFQKGDRLNIGIASDTPFSFDGDLLTLRLTLRAQPDEDDELYKVIKVKSDEKPASQNDAILFSGVKDGGLYNRSVSVLINEGTALLNEQPYTPGTPISGDGEYTLTATDLTGRTRTIHFTIDCTPPVIIISEYNTTPLRGPLTVYASVEGGTLNAESHTFTENDSFTFTATDAAGNKAEETVTISHLYTKVELSLSGAPAEPSVLEGKQLDINGWELVAVFKDKTGVVIGQETVPVTEEMLTYSTDTPGRQEVVLRWKGEEMRFTIQVEAAEVIRIEITALPEKLSYVTGEKLDTTGLELTLFLNNGTVEKISSGFTVTGFDNTQIGRQTLTVIYDGKKAVFEVSVRPGAPSAPVLESKTDTSVTLKAFSGYEYQMDGGVWQKSNIFTGLAPNSTHSFRQRIAETDTSYASDASTALVIATYKSQPAAPELPVLLSKTSTSITLVAVSGCEYSIDSVHWQDNPIFTDLSPDTEYSLYQRIKETDINYASASSSALIVTTSAIVMGDANGDGSIDIRDLVRMKKMTATGDYTKSADLISDNKIDALDLVEMRKYLLL